MNRHGPMKGARRSVATAMALALVMFATDSHAIQCNGTIQALYVDASGNVLIDPSFRDGWVLICNLTTAWSGVDPVTCKSWMALATTLRATHDNVLIYYSSDTIQCNTIPTYGGAPAPGYLMYYVP